MSREQKQLFYVAPAILGFSKLKPNSLLETASIDYIDTGDGGVTAPVEGFGED